MHDDEVDEKLEEEEEEEEEEHRGFYSTKGIDTKMDLTNGLFNNVENEDLFQGYHNDKDLFGGMDMADYSLESGKKSKKRKSYDVFDSRNWF